MTYLAWVWLACAAVAVAVVVGAFRARRAWGPREARHALGDASAYREGDARTFAVRPTPRTVTLAAVAAGVWAVLTLFVFVPLGLVGLLLMWDPPAARIAIPFALVICGLGVRRAFLGLTVARALVTRAEGAAEAAEREARASVLHHLAVFVVYVGGIGLHAPYEAPSDAVIFLVPCALGALVALGLHRAARAVREVDRQDRDALAAR